MFFYNDMNKYLLNLHFNEKIYFFNFFYFNNYYFYLYSILSIKIQYMLMPTLNNFLLSSKTKLYFFFYLNIFLTFWTRLTYESYISTLSNLYKNNNFYFFLINNSYIYNIEKQYLIYKKNVGHNKNDLYISYISDLEKIFLFKEVTSVRARIFYSITTNIDNFYLNRLFFSYIALPIM